MNLHEVGDLYLAAARCVVSRELVVEPSVDDFTIELRALESCLGGLVDDEPWLSALRPMRRARWLLHTVPLPSTDPALGLATLLLDADRMMRNVGEGAAPETKARVDDSLEMLRELTEVPARILLDTLEQILIAGGDGSATVLLHDASMTSSVQDVFRGGSMPPLAVLCPAQLRSWPAHESQIVVGPSRQFPDWVFNAPRAEIISVIHRASSADRSSVPGLLGGKSSIVPIRGHAAAGMSASPFVVEAPTVDWAGLRQDATGEGHLESVKGRVFLLAGQLRVVLEASDAATVFVVQPGAPAGELTGRVPTSGVEPGDYLLLRERDGDEDAIMQIADRILGNRAFTLRGQQNKWKSELRQRVSCDGVQRAYRKLEALGCRAHNLPHWLGPDAIRTQSATDFAAICSYCGFGADETAVLWKAMSDIRGAHIKAGHELRELLEKRLRTADLSTLLRDGYMSVMLPDVKAGSLGIFRVEAKDPDVIMVHPRILQVATKAGLG